VFPHNWKADPGKEAKESARVKRNNWESNIDGRMHRVAREKGKRGKKRFQARKSEPGGRRQEKRDADGEGSRKKKK